MSFRESFMHLLRVPRAPSPPAGDDNVRVFQAAPELMIYKFAEWAMKNIAAGIGLYAGLKFVSFVPDSLPSIPVLWFTIPGSFIRGVIAFIESLAVISYITQALFGLVLIRLDFENRWYMVSDRSLRIRHGLVHMREITMTFANVQHVGIRQGPLQRIIGIADVEVRTAGGSALSEAMQKNQADGTHVAYFEGIKDAKMVSDVIRERLRLHRDAGLGDPDDHMPHGLPHVSPHVSPHALPYALPNENTPHAPSAHDTLTAARSLADEARLLRLALFSAAAPRV